MIEARGRVVVAVRPDPDLGVRLREAVGERHALDLVPQHPHLADRLGRRGQLGALRPDPGGLAPTGGPGEKGVPVEVPGLLAPRPGAVQQPRRDLLGRPVGPSDAEAVALALEGRAPGCLLGGGRPAVGSAQTCSGRDDALDLGAHLGGDDAAVRRTSSLGRRGDRPPRVVAVGQEGNGGQGQGEDGRRDGGGVSQRGPRRGDAHGEVPRSVGIDRPTVPSGHTGRKCLICGGRVARVSFRGYPGISTPGASRRPRDSVERMTRFELATSTLGRSRSTS